MSKKLILLGVVTMIILSGCGDKASKPTSTSMAPSDNMNHTNHISSSEIPQGLKTAKNPTYPIGSKAFIQADHMPGMKGAAATIVGAYETTAYAVTFTPTTGGKPMSNHKWVIQEEIKNPGDKPLTSGTQITIIADHTPGMKDATATIDSAQQTVVYMVDFTPTTGGKLVKNHKWVTESELSTK